MFSPKSLLQFITHTLTNTLTSLGLTLSVAWCLVGLIVQLWEYTLRLIRWRLWRPEIDMYNRVSDKSRRIEDWSMNRKCSTIIHTYIHTYTYDYGIVIMHGSFQNEVQSMATFNLHFHSRIPFLSKFLNLASSQLSLRFTFTYI